MPIPRRFARWGLALTMLTLGACTGQAPPTTASSAVPTSPAIPFGTLSAVTVTPPGTVPPGRTPMPCLTRAELAGMALEELAAEPTLCFDSEDGVKTQIAQAEAVETIRAFLQAPTRLIVFREVTFMGNSPSGVLPVARFEDEGGASYLVAVVAGKVLEMNSDPGPLQPGGDVLPDEQLQSIAEDLIRRELPTFDDLQDRLMFEAGAKDGVNFFRWELAGWSDSTSMPPLAQVGVTDAGEIFSYLNTLYFLQ